MNIERYIGIPFKSHGRDFSGCDCYGLVRLVLQEEKGITLPDFWDYEDANRPENVQGIIAANTTGLGFRKDTPEEGDVVLYKIFGYPSHMGLYVGKGRVLHVMRKFFSVCVPVEHGILRGRVEGFYGIREDYISSK